MQPVAKPEVHCRASPDIVRKDSPAVPGGIRSKRAVLFSTLVGQDISLTISRDQQRQTGRDPQQPEFGEFIHLICRPGCKARINDPFLQVTVLAFCLGRGCPLWRACAALTTPLQSLTVTLG
eukprot:4766380-Amphidinium_carterae.1